MIGSERKSGLDTGYWLHRTESTGTETAALQVLDTQMCSNVVHRHAFLLYFSQQKYTQTLQSVVGPHQALVQSKVKSRLFTICPVCNSTCDCSPFIDSQPGKQGFGMVCDSTADNTFRVSVYHDE